ncbi:hypothetical protein L484_014631 [Morus notabilis]|uniref:Uncharacterized protein n=1 Tax=Morus notabilis TaxID=981085 RepID=W9QYV0_9ROSA|nr:hypothetical protein L484_014631 [Morus notabilis]
MRIDEDFPGWVKPETVGVQRHCLAGLWISGHRDDSQGSSDSFSGGDGSNLMALEADVQHFGAALSIVWLSFLGMQTFEGCWCFGGFGPNVEVQMQRGSLLGRLAGVDDRGVAVVNRAWFFEGLWYRGLCLGGTTLVVEAAAWLVAAVEQRAPT